MNWISIELGTLSGALAAIIASLIVRNPREKRSIYGIVFVVSLIVPQGLSREYIFPDLNAWNQARNTESALLEVPTFQAIKRFDPKH